MSFDTAETGVATGAPLEVYLFEMGAQSWAFTPNDGALVVSGVTYDPATISRGEIDLSGEDEQGSLEVTLPRSSDVVGLFIPDLPPHPVTLTVRVGHRTETEWRVLWSGEIASCDVRDSEATLTGLPISRALRRILPPNTFSAMCNWEWGSPQCGVDVEAYRLAIVVAALGGMTVTAADLASKPDGYFKGGWLEAPDGETHWIVRHVGDTVTLMSPFRSLPLGASLSAFPGCEHTIAACKTFNNLPNFLGCPWTPNRNAFVVGL